MTKPDVFSGDSVEWREWKLKFVSYMEYTDDRFGDALDGAARQQISILWDMVPQQFRWGRPILVCNDVGLLV